MNQKTSIKSEIEEKVSEQDALKYIAFLDNNIPGDFSKIKNTGRYVGGDPGGFYLKIERNGYLGNNQKIELNNLISYARKDNIVALMEDQKFRPIEKIRDELDGHNIHVLMGIAGPTAKRYGASIILYIMNLESSGPRNR